MLVRHVDERSVGPDKVNRPHREGDEIHLKHVIISGQRVTEQGDRIAPLICAKDMT